MSVPSAYLAIILIWSTTPLAIQWSAETVTPVAALAVRMLIAAVVGCLMLAVMRKRICWSKPAVLTYLYSQFGIVVAMLCVYSASKFIPSGLISVLFALAPLFASLFAVLLLNEAAPRGEKIVAFIVSFGGLLVIFLDDLVVQGDGWIGVALLLAAVSFYSLSGVLVQKVGYKGHALSITVASLIVSLPMFFLAWVVMDGALPVIDWSSRSPFAIVYLAIAGSLLGFCAYFFLIKNAGASAVAMVTLVTPALALMLGSFVNGEEVGTETIVGTLAIICGLFLYYRESLLGLRRRRSSAVSG